MRRARATAQHTTPAMTEKTAMAKSSEDIGNVNGGR
jgi:hypothetical protein